jgi:hypothetical protein
MNQRPEWVKFMRKQYPPGTRIRLTEMKDPYAPVPPGTEGTVDHIDDACQLHMKWDNGRTLALIPGVDSFSIIPQPLQTLKLYMPLTVDCYERNKWGDMENEPTYIDSQDAVYYEDSIYAAIVRERMPEEKERGLMHWYHGEDSVNEKVRSAVFSVENVRSRLWGTVECEVKGELTPEEMKIFKDYISGQASDGWGEGFEQRPIKTADGEIYVHLCSGEKNWSIMTENEFQSAQNQQMGGMTLG